jgi:hypothetical protein
MPRWPTAPFDPHRTGCYRCQRMTPADGACGVHDYPCTHWGIDTFTLDGSRNVWAPERAVVVAVSDGNSAPFVGYGPGVVLLHGVSGVYHLLAHLDADTIRVTPGQQLDEATPIGLFNSDIGHCHYEVRREPVGPSESNTIDPSRWLATMSGGGSSFFLWMLGLGVLGYAVWRYRQR